jgi:hypothetical protein
MEIIDKDVSLQTQIAENNIHDAKQYSLDIAIESMAAIYREFM